MARPHHGLVGHRCDPVYPVSSATELYILRFLLGIAEAGFFHGAILFLSARVPSRHRNKILALFYLAQPLTTVIGAPLAAQLINMHGAFGLEGWRIMFFGVAAPQSLSVSLHGSTCPIRQMTRGGSPLTNVTGSMMHSPGKK